MRRRDEMTVTLAKRGTKPRVFTVPMKLARERGLAQETGKAPRRNCSRKSIAELADDVLGPAAVLRGSRYEEGMTQAVLAAQLGIRQSHLSEMENGKRAISKGMARNLAAVFGCDYRVFP